MIEYWKFIGLIPAVWYYIDSREADNSPTGVVARIAVSAIIVSGLAIMFGK